MIALSMEARRTRTIGYFFKGQSGRTKKRTVKDFDHPEWHHISLPIYLDKSDEQALARTFRPNLATTYRPGTPAPKLNAIQALDFARQTITDNAGLDATAVRHLERVGGMELAYDTFTPAKFCETS